MQWERMLAAVVTDPDTTIGDQIILTDDELRQLLVDWNVTAADYPREQCVQEMFEAQVVRVPDRTAVRSGTCSLSYAELEARANRFAHALRERGVKRGQHIGVCVDRSADMLAVVLGILKAGAAYVPLDPSFPEERLRLMAEDAQPGPTGVYFGTGGTF